MMKRFRLSEFEARAQQLVEGSFGRLLGGELGALDVTNRLAKALEDSQKDGRVADIFTISLHQQDAARILAEQPDIEQVLADYVGQLARQSGWRLVSRPYVTLAADPRSAPHEVLILAEHSQSAQPTTEFNLPRPDLDEAAQEILAAVQAVDAYLIVDGGRHVALDRPLVSLGRRMDNDVVLDAATVSRRHAQIRWRYGRFVLYDLSNRPGRTLVNGEPVQEYVLQSGDVITLSTMKIIYGEGQDDLNGKDRSDRAFVEEETIPRPIISNDDQ
ncbi:MAG: DUF3662 domain-containing protein [Ardenticatenaceae bacterium]|nr:DUF3662 domain-containing protein [Anaerolineales bacterium]MCB8985189.1 DUF3662 domain-containing protein [Ardenticatenaceae bacterium]